MLGAAKCCCSNFLKQLQHFSGSVAAKPSRDPLDSQGSSSSSSNDPAATIFSLPLFRRSLTFFFPFAGVRGAMLRFPVRPPGSAKLSLKSRFSSSDLFHVGLAGRNVYTRASSGN
ncbi:Hypothetical predicted protein [Podarcis lilfordi]|uniref:Uncharacterized protein n=1 Tax=Podarcis lilfordi TaxID=74358 RepID=A0AA35NZ70_9SAUR|nr:Hypothetical predicted protein [Podarcis lilfordi]